jgi:hypothetical protein
VPIHVDNSASLEGFVSVMQDGIVSISIALLNKINFCINTETIPLGEGSF